MESRDKLRRLLAISSIIAMSLGTLALAGCGNDDGAPPMEPMEEPAQNEPIQPEQGQEGAQGGMGEQDSMGSDSGTTDDSSGGGSY